MAANDGYVVVANDTVIKGEIRNCRQIEIHGYVEGDLDAENVMIHQSGRLFGKIKASNAQVNGQLQGEVAIKHLISIGNTGSVTGNVRYGRLSLAEGGELSAEMRNIPPEIGGDLDITVGRGRSVVVTSMDLTAIDPDNTAEELTYTVSNESNGFVAFKDTPKSKIAEFTQADLETGKIVFTHDNSQTQSASFDVVVADAEGGNSGSQTVKAHVKA